MRTAPIRLAAAAAVVALAAGACGGGGAAPRATDPAALPPCEPTGLISPGEELPDCTFEGLPGHPATISLRALRGRPLVINFWASWCVYCVREMPDFQQVYESFGDRVRFLGMDFLGGTQRETRPAAIAFARKTGVRYLMAYDPEGRLYSHFQPNVIRPILPITVFVDATGVVRERHFGPLTERQLRAALEEHLGLTG